MTQSFIQSPLPGYWGESRTQGKLLIPQKPSFGSEAATNSMETNQQRRSLAENSSSLKQEKKQTATGREEGKRKREERGWRREEGEGRRVQGLGGIPQPGLQPLTV